MPLSSVVGAQSIVKPGVCTSTTRPASPYVGQCIYETDTLLAKVWDGSTWADYPQGKANTASPTFTGTVVLPSTTSIGTVSATEIGYVDGVTSAIQTQLDSKLTATTATTSGRNLLINGDFKVWQRGSARTYMNAGSYLADRWTIHLFQNGGHERVAGRATQYSMRVTSSSTAENGGGTRMWLTQKVESSNSYRLRNQQVTLSFWVRFSAATCSSSTATAYGNFTGTIGYYTSTTDSATGNTSENTGTSVTLTNGSLPTTWTKYSITGTCPSDLNNIHASFGFAGLGSTAANSGVWYEIAEVQLEVGTVATPFEFEDHGTTLAKCQRYYQRRSGEKNYGLLTAQNTTNLYGTIPLPVNLRVPAISIDAGSLRAFDLFNGAAVFYTFGLDGNASTESVVAIAATTAGLTGFRTYYIIHNGASSYLGFNAEL